MVEAGARLAFAYVRNRHGLRDRRPLGRFIWRNLRYLVAASRHRFVEAEMSGLRVVVSTADRTIARSVYAAGDWDPLLVGTVFEALDGAGYDHRRSTFVEIGANFGVYALPAVAEYGFDRAVAYEPDPGSFRLLRRNIARNHLESRVAAHNAALSAAPGELTLALGGGNAGDNRIVQPGAAAGRRMVRVPALTFDDEVARGNIPLDDVGLVWLDVQGHESEVLAGASSLLAAGVPIVLEYSTAMMSAAARRRLDETIATSFEALVDIGWSSLADRIRFQPAAAIHELAAPGWHVETDLLLLPGRRLAGLAATR